MKIMLRVLRTVFSFISKFRNHSSDPSVSSSWKSNLCEEEINLTYPMMASGSLDTLDISEIGLTHDILGGVSDYMTGQVPPPSSVCPNSCQQNQDELTKLLGMLKNYWTQLEDPLDERILITLKNISTLSNDTRGDLTGKYKHLVRISGDDMPQLLDELIEICLLGPKTLISSLKISIVAYTSALARNAKSTIADISTASTDLMTITQMIQSQQDSFQSSLEHLSHAWNNVASSMTAYTSELDQKTLKLTQLSSHHKQDLHRTPSTTSSHNPDTSVGTRMTIIPGFSYKSYLGILTCCPNGNIGFLATISDGAWIAKLVDVMKKPTPLEKVLNKDLNELVKYLQGNPQILTTYANLLPSEKVAIINTINTCIPDLTNQWIKS